MQRLVRILAVIGAACAAWPSPAEEPPGGKSEPPIALPLPRRDYDTPGSPAFAAILAQDPFAATNGSGAGDADAANGDGKSAAKAGPGHIRDNAFLVEEAYNQEAGVVQHIFNWVHLWDRTPQGRTRDFAFTYTMELPLGSQAHQFSFTTLFLTAFEKPSGGPATQQGGVGDTFLNYRYQLLADDDFLWCAPRASLIVPTGDERFGLGTGRLGYQFNLPVSRYGEDYDVHFNAGLTFIPNVSAFLAAGADSPDGQPPTNASPVAGSANGSAARRSPRHDLHGYNLGASAFWKPKTSLHFFVEALALWIEAIDDGGAVDHSTQVFVNPGVRYAVCQFEDAEWVIGVSVPVGLTRDTPDIGVFAYMSVEHTFRKRRTGGE